MGVMMREKILRMILWAQYRIVVVFKMCALSIQQRKQT